jgi:hypothetical protein
MEFRELRQNLKSTYDVPFDTTDCLVQINDKEVLSVSEFTKRMVDVYHIRDPLNEDEAIQLAKSDHKEYIKSLVI